MLPLLSVTCCRVTPPTSLAANHSPASVEEEMMFDKRQTTDSAASSRGSPTSLKRIPCSLSLPWNRWRQVTLDEVSSDSSDGGTDGPERSEVILFCVCYDSVQTCTRT